MAATLAVATVVLLMVLRTDEVGRVAAPETRASIDISRPSTPAPAPATGADQKPGIDATPGRGTGEEAGLLLRRSGERQVGRKSFQSAAGEWIDREYEPIAGLPVIEVTTREARGSLLARVPALRPYAALGPRVTVVHDGTVYKFAAAAR